MNWIGSDNVLKKKREYLFPCVYHFYREPPQMVRGKGVYLYDSNGKDYLDFYSGVSVHALGHCHPEIVETICQQVQTLQHTTTIYLNESIVNLAESLASFYPQKIQKTFFCASGSEAVEGGCFLASLYTGRSEYIALQGGLHGRTKLGMSLTGLSFWRTDSHPVGGITHIPHCGTDSPEECSQKNVQVSINALKSAIEFSTSGKIAAFIAEPIQGNGGIITPPKEYFSKIYDVVKNAGGLFISDETQTGFGRTGYNFGIDYYGVAPDIICGGKAIGGGTPVGFFATTEEIASCYSRPGASTFGGNPVTAEAGIKLLEILKRDNLIQKSRDMGLEIQNLLLALQKKYPDCIGTVRGRGLMWGVEINGNVSSTFVDDVLENCKNNGLLLGKTGVNRNVLTIMPPFIVTSEQISLGIEKLTAAIENCVK